MGSPGLLQQVLPWTKKPIQRGTGGDTLALTSSALSVGAMNTMNGESSAVRTILRVCGERAAVTRVWPSPRLGLWCSGGFGDLSSLGGLLEKGSCNPLPEQPGCGLGVTDRCVL